MDSQEREFWDLEGSSKAEEKAEARTDERAEEEETAPTAGGMPETPSEDPIITGERKAAEEEFARAHSSGPVGESVDAAAGDSATASAEQAADEANDNRQADRTESAGGEGASASPAKEAGKFEKISLIVLGVFLLGIAIWGLSLFFKGIPTTPKTAEVEFPVVGQFVTIKDVSTYWRRPNPTTDRGIRRNSRIIPAAVIHLAGSSGQGALRVFFEDDSGQLIGDPTTLAVSGGVFEADSVSEAEIYGTGGFRDTGEHAAYVTGQIDLWHLIIKEGPDRNAAGSKFTELLRIPVSVNRK